MPGLLLALSIFVFGLQPNWVLRWSESTVATFALPTTIVAELGDK
jgi:NADH:ubiquinone oxidoreductase subunit 4 (subunit M)